MTSLQQHVAQLLGESDGGLCVAVLAERLAKRGLRPKRSHLNRALQRLLSGRYRHRSLPPPRRSEPRPAPPPDPHPLGAIVFAKAKPLINDRKRS